MQRRRRSSSSSPHSGPPSQVRSCSLSQRTTRGTISIESSRQPRDRLLFYCSLVPVTIGEAPSIQRKCPVSSVQWTLPSVSGVPAVRRSTWKLAPAIPAGTEKFARRSIGMPVSESVPIFMSPGHVIVFSASLMEQGIVFEPDTMNGSERENKPIFWYENTSCSRYSDLLVMLAPFSINELTSKPEPDRKVSVAADVRITLVTRPNAV